MKEENYCIGRTYPIKRLVFTILIVAAICSIAQAKYSGGSGTADDPYQIGSATDLLALAADMNDYNKYFVLTADIDLGSYSFTNAVITPDTDNSTSGHQGVQFTGVFDGAGHKIINLTINTNEVGNEYLGLFGYVESGEIKNLGLENVNITGGNESSFLGGLVGDNWGTISNCHSKGAVTGGDSSNTIGGLVGKNEGNINNCHSTGILTGGDYSQDIGGLVGHHNSGDISNCYSTGAVSGTWILGGLVGSGSGSISNCHSTGAVTGDSELGGLMGYTYDSSIDNCYSTGAVTGYSELGGLMGWNLYGTVSNCYSTGDVTGSDGSQYVGGLAGYNVGSSISNCYSRSAVSAASESSDIGGLVGNSNSTISNCYYTSLPNNGYGTVLTDEQMRQQSSFIGWDFVGETINGPNDVWWINEGVSYPEFFWQPALIQVAKCTVAAGSKTNTDKISASGLMDVTEATLNSALNTGVIEVVIDSNYIADPCVYVFPIDDNTFKKGKFSCSARTGKGVKKSFKYDVETGKFAFAASNVNLAGLSCPITFDISVGNYLGAAEVNETVVNGKKPIPIKFLMGVKNSLRVDKSKLTRDKKTDQIIKVTVSGGFSATDTGNANLAINPLDVTVGSQTFTFPGKFRFNKGKFTCSKMLLPDGEIAAATFDFNKCTFTLTIKNTNFTADADKMEFGIDFADFSEDAEVLLP